MTSNSTVQGWVSEGFEEVYKAFAENFSRRRELGAACCVYYRGDKVVDLWGGLRDRKSREPWEQDTLVTVASTTKGLSGMTLAVAHSRGLVDFEERVATYWPEFAQKGKETITVRQLLSHQAGLCALDEPLTFEDAGNLDRVAESLAAQRPLWKPGTRQGYHALTLGWYEGELIRRIDPLHRSLGHFFQDEIAKPLGLEFYIGLPESVPDRRIATVEPFSLFDIVMGINNMPLATTLGFLARDSVTSRAFRFPISPKGVPNRERLFLSIEGPAYNGIGQVRSIAKAYGALAAGGKEVGLKEGTFKAISEASDPPSYSLRDEVLKLETRFSVGYLKPFKGFSFGMTEKSFGMPGMGGSIGFADPEKKVGFAYAPNKWAFRLLDDPRQTALCNALKKCLT